MPSVCRARPSRRRPPGATIVGAAGARFDAIARSLAVRDFLDRSGWGEAAPRPFHRRRLGALLRAVSAGRPAAARADELAAAGARPAGARRQAPMPRSPTPRASVSAFVAIDRAAARQPALPCPEIHAQDLDQGLLLHRASRLGKLPRRRRRAGRRALRSRRPSCSPRSTAEAWPTRPRPRPASSTSIPPFDRAAMMIEAELLLDWYVPACRRPRRRATPSAPAFAAVWNAALDRLAGQRDEPDAARLPFAQHHLARRAHRPRPARHRSTSRTR